MEITCGQISDETIELEALGKLQIDLVRRHLVRCRDCQKRVADHRNWISALKLALRELQTSPAWRRIKTTPTSSPESEA